MRILAYSLLLILVPLSVFGQESTTFSDSPVILIDEPTEESNYYLVTPVLMRKPFVQSYEDQLIVQNGSKFQSFFSSLIVPGSGQIRNHSWWKAGLFLAIEAASVYMFVDNRNNARVGEREYEKFANRNWSVVQYSNWLIEYHEINGLENSSIDDLKDIIGDNEATFDVKRDWSLVDINLLREVERQTPYVTSDQNVTNNFSHRLPEYGSQQYYELISKYYQYQGGWRDYHDYHDRLGHTGSFFIERYFIERNGAYASPFFYEAAQMAKQFNSDYRASNTFLSILIANHVLSAFDAYFTFRLKQNRIEATSSIMPGKQLQLTYKF